MLIIASKLVQPLVIVSSTIIGTVLLTCYGLAVYLDHVPIWIPFISECAVHPPEQFIFTLGLVPGGMMLWVACLIVYFTDQGWSLSKVALVIGTISSIGLIVTATISMREHLVMHTGAALIFFVLYAVYMVLVSCCSDIPMSGISRNIKRLCALIGAASNMIITGWVVYAVAIAEIGNNSQERSAVPIVAEWVGVYSAVIFNMSLVLDMKDFYLCLARTEEAADENEKKKFR